MSVGIPSMSEPKDKCVHIWYLSIQRLKQKYRTVCKYNHLFFIPGIHQGIFHDMLALILRQGILIQHSILKLREIFSNLKLASDASSVLLTCPSIKQGRTKKPFGENVVYLIFFPTS